MFAAAAAASPEPEGIARTDVIPLKPIQDYLALQVPMSTEPQRFLTADPASTHLIEAPNSSTHSQLRDLLSPSSLWPERVLYFNRGGSIHTLDVSTGVAEVFLEGITSVTSIHCKFGKAFILTYSALYIVDEVTKRTEATVSPTRTGQNNNIYAFCYNDQPAAIICQNACGFSLVHITSGFAEEPQGRVAVLRSPVTLTIKTYEEGYSFNNVTQGSNNYENLFFFSADYVPCVFPYKVHIDEASFELQREPAGIRYSKSENLPTSEAKLQLDFPDETTAHALVDPFNRNSQDLYINGEISYDLEKTSVNVRFCSWGPFLAAGIDEYSLELFDYSTKKRLLEYRRATGGNQYLRAPVRVVKFSPTPLAPYLVFADCLNGLYIIHLYTHKMQAIMFPQNNYINGMCFSPDAKYLYVAHTLRVTRFRVRVKETLTDHCVDFIRSNPSLAQQHHWDFSTLPSDLAELLKE